MLLTPLVKSLFQISEFLVLEFPFVSILVSISLLRFCVCPLIISLFTYLNTVLITALKFLLITLAHLGVDLHRMLFLCEYTSYFCFLCLIILNCILAIMNDSGFCYALLKSLIFVLFYQTLKHSRTQTPCGRHQLNLYSFFSFGQTAWTVPNAYPVQKSGRF